MKKINIRAGTKLLARLDGKYRGVAIVQGDLLFLTNEGVYLLEDGERIRKIEPVLGSMAKASNVAVAKNLERTIERAITKRTRRPK